MIVKIWKLLLQLMESLLFARLKLTKIRLDLTEMSVPVLTWKLSQEGVGQSAQLESLSTHHTIYLDYNLGLKYSLIKSI